MTLHSDVTNPHRPVIASDSDPEAVGAHKWWLDTSSGIVYRRNAGNDDWLVVYRPRGVRLEETDEYTLADGDEDQHIRVSHATAATVTVPKDATHEFEVGTRIRIEQAGDGAVTVAPEDSDPTILSREGELATSAQYTVVELVKIAADEWVLRMIADPAAHTHERADLPSEVAYEDEANTFTSAQTFSGDVTMSALPTSDPAVAGRLWNDAGTLKVSAG